MNPYREAGTRTWYQEREPTLTDQRVALAAPPTLYEPEYDRFSLDNICRSGLIAYQRGPFSPGKVAICFSDVAFVYPSLEALQKDLKRRWADRKRVAYSPKWVWDLAPHKQNIL